MISYQQAAEKCAALKGQKLQYIYRCCDLIDIGFGDLVERMNRRNKDVTVATYVLHLQCPFRITNKKGIITGYSDLYMPLENAEDPVDLNEQNTSLFDTKIKDAIQDYHDEYVTDITLNCVGDITITLSHIGISVFVASSVIDEESWRFFEVNSDKEHLVAFGNGFELC